MLSPGLRDELRPNAEIDGRFRLGSQLPSNPYNNAVAFNAIDTTTGADTVVKAFHLDIQQDDLLFGPTRFARELHAGTNINHPSVLRVIGCGVIFDDNQYIATPKANQGSLADAHIDTYDIENASLVWNALLDIGDGIHAGHQKGYVHSDVNPGNMLLHNYKGWLSDFGIVSSVKNSALSKDYPFSHDLLIAHSRPPLTTRYASPEQLSSCSEEELQPETDIYSWGISVLHMMNGKHPYTKSGYVPDDLNTNAAYDYASRVKTRNQDHLPTEMYDLLAHCIKKYPRERPQDFSEILEIGRTILSLEAIGDTKQLVAR